MKPFPAAERDVEARVYYNTDTHKLEAVAFFCRDYAKQQMTVVPANCLPDEVIRWLNFYAPNPVAPNDEAYDPSDPCSPMGRARQEAESESDARQRDAHENKVWGD